MTRYYVGVDVGGTNLRCAVVNDKHEVLSRHQCATCAAEGAQAVIGRIAEGMMRTVEEAGLKPANIAAAGVGIPGPINQRTGLVYSATNMPGWDNVALAQILTERTGVTSFLENDANCAGWGEFMAGAGRDCNSMVMVTLGTGIGGAIILDGKLIIGCDGTAGEIGHMCIADGGRVCGCGARGCVEAYASASSVARRFVDLLKEGWKSPLAAKGEAVTSQDIYTAADSGDPVAMHIVEETGRYLGILCNSLAEALNPELCVISGGMIEAGEELFAAIRTGCRERNRHPAPKTMEILPAALGANAGLVGAADCARVRLEGTIVN